VKLDDGPELIVPFLDRSPGTGVVVEIRADDILLARQPLGGLSARNQIGGVVERIIPHGPDAEAVVRTDGRTWLVSLVAPAIDQLALEPGASIHLIIKARSCHVRRDESISPNI
jgi:molybdate transport system ATP-binding protein